jgi:hypothetical protein
MLSRRWVRSKQKSLAEITGEMKKAEGSLLPIVHDRHHFEEIEKCPRPPSRELIAVRNLNRF